MGTRVIRGDVLASRSLSCVSWQADWLWHKLLLAADEFGRLDGRLDVLRSQCFPSRPDVTTDLLAGWLGELESCDPDGSGPLRRYEVDGWPYIQLVNWEKHRGKCKRAESSRFPDPPQISAEFRGETRFWSGGSGLVVGDCGLVKESVADAPSAEDRAPSRAASDPEPEEVELSLEEQAELNRQCDELDAAKAAPPAAAPPAPTPPDPELPPEVGGGELGRDRALLNLLRKLPGSAREKELWLLDCIDQLRLETDTPKQLAALAIRWYKAYLRRGKTSPRKQYREFEMLAERERFRAIAAERGIPEGPEPEDPEAERAAYEALRANGNIVHLRLG